MNRPPCFEPIQNDQPVLNRGGKDLSGELQYADGEPDVALADAIPGDRDEAGQRNRARPIFSNLTSKRRRSCVKAGSREQADGQPQPGTDGQRAPSASANSQGWPVCEVGSSLLSSHRLVVRTDDFSNAIVSGDCG